MALVVLAPATAAAAHINAADCTPAAVQAAIDAAVDGDIVVIPAGACTWTSGVTITGKGIELRGAGSGRIIARSESVVSIGAGSKTFTIQSGLDIVPGQTLRVSQLGARTHYMQGTVTAYSGTTLTLDVTSQGGSGTQKLWIVSTPPATVITHDINGVAPTIDVWEDTTHHVEITGIKIANGSGNARRIMINRTGNNGKAVLLHDCWLEAGIGADLFWTDSNRGVIWNCSFDSSPFAMAQLAIHHQADDVVNSWTTPSTMGAADTTGQNNLYIEDSDFHAFLHATDFDNNARAVLRHVLFNNAAVGTHGPDTSLWGQRHFEVYDSRFVFNPFSDGSTFPLNHWFFVRGGTFVVTDNVMDVIRSSDYPGKGEFEITIMNLQRASGPNPCWGANVAGTQYPAPRQAGFGYVSGAGVDGLARSVDGVTYIGDAEPMYIWNNTSNGAILVDTSDYGTNECPGGDESSTYVQAGRDYFLDAGPKPGYVKYAFPHPLRLTTLVPSAPTGLRRVETQ